MSNPFASAIQSCRRCPLGSQRTQAVPALCGIQSPRLALMGEAPGRHEDATGEPFIGQAGRLLDGVLAECGLRRVDLLLMNMVRCRPPSNNLTAHPEAVAACRTWTESELTFYNPSVVVLMGKTAAQEVFGKGATVGSIRGTLRATGPTHPWGKRAWIVTYHPASALPGRTPGNREWIVQDLRTAAGFGG